MSTSLYDTDFYAWTQHQAALLRAEEFEAVDWNNLIEEIDSLGKSQRQEVRSRLTILIMHLLKLQYQPARRTRSWRTTISTQRADLEPLLTDNPTLRAHLALLIAEAYPIAVKKAAAETGLDKQTFPVECPWPAAQLLDEEFWPT